MKSIDGCDINHMWNPMWEHNTIYLMGYMEQSLKPGRTEMEEES